MIKTIKSCLRVSGLNISTYTILNEHTNIYHFSPFFDKIKKKEVNKKIIAIKEMARLEEVLS